MKTGEQMIDVTPEKAGMEADRLARIDDHLMRRYIAPGKIAGCQTLVARYGHVAHFSSLGYLDRERQVPVGEDAIWRIYSMTKPVTAAALLSLYERGVFQLSDPVHRLIPEWSDLKVAELQHDGSTRLAEPHRPVTIYDLLTHTSGVGYGPRNRGFRTKDAQVISNKRNKDGQTLQSLAERLATFPLRFQPGTSWLYSLSTDVCARLVEILSGRQFDKYLRDELLAPLGMGDTGFSVPEDELHRFAASYGRNSIKELVLLEAPEASAYRSKPSLLSGGGGLVSTTVDYLAFCQMLLNGGSLGDARILGRKTVELMTTNHLPRGEELGDHFFEPTEYWRTNFKGIGYGLGVGVGLGPTATGVSGSAGEYMWSGLASSLFWIDPVESLIVIFMTQLVPAGTFNFRDQLKALVYSAIT